MHASPKVEEYGDSLLAVIHSVELIEGELLIGVVHVFVGDTYILSNRTRVQQGFADVRVRCEREAKHLKQGPAFILCALMDAMVDRYFSVADALEAKRQKIEEQIFASPTHRSTLEQLYQLKRKTVLFKNAVAPPIEAVGKLEGGRVPLIVANTTEYFRDVHDHLHRINTAIDSIRDTISTAIQVNLR